MYIYIYICTYIYMYIYTQSVIIPLIHILPINGVNSSENNVYQHLLAIYKHVGRSCRS